MIDSEIQGRHIGDFWETLTTGINRVAEYQQRRSDRRHGVVPTTVPVPDNTGRTMTIPPSMLLMGVGLVAIILLVK
jgi:hypothetical protein